MNTAVQDKINTVVRMYDEYWLRFASSGKIKDYLEYRQHAEHTKGFKDENNNERLSDKGTDNRGE